MTPVNTPNARFLVLAAETMLDLLAKMQIQSHPIAQLKYMGKNEGDYSQYENQELVKATQYIAVFDFAPVYIVEIQNVIINQNNGENDTEIELSPEIDLAMSA